MRMAEERFIFTTEEERREKTEWKHGGIRRPGETSTLENASDGLSLRLKC